MSSTQTTLHQSDSSYLNPVLRTVLKPDLKSCNINNYDRGKFYTQCGTEFPKKPQHFFYTLPPIYKFTYI